MKTPSHHPLADPYDSPFAARYSHPYRTGLALRLADWRHRQLARRALRLAGDPGLVLDLSCGPGRFWPLLAEKPNRVILAAEHEPHLLEAARNLHAPDIAERVHTLRTTNWTLDLGDAAVDCIFCMRPPPRIIEAGPRQVLWRELRRVTRDTLIVALPVRGACANWWHRRTRREPGAGFGLPAAAAEGEFAVAGFAVLAAQDFLPGCSPWRVYTLRKQP